MASIFFTHDNNFPLQCQTKLHCGKKKTSFTLPEDAGFVAKAADRYSWSLCSYSSCCLAELLNKSSPGAY